MLEISDSTQFDAAVVSVWNRLVDHSTGLPGGVSVTSLYELAQLALQVHASDAHARTFVWKDHDEIVGILPTVVLNEPGMIRSRRLRLLTDLYPGRPGPLVADSPEAGDQLLRALIGSTGWDTMEVTWVSGSRTEESFVAVARELKLEHRRLPKIDCPYIRFPDSWDSYLGTLSKKFRYNLRSREKKLRGAGKLKLVRVEHPDQVEEFLESVKKVENNSWKEAAGTSLTTNPRQWEFHERMVPICADDNLLRSYVMTLDDAPIAYIIGLLYSGTFYCMKSSFADSHRKFSPGVVLKSRVMQELIEEGVNWWDFVGPSAEHKRQWTESSYGLSRYLVFGRSLRASVMRMRFDVAQQLRGQS